nr:putative ribonuclease H-like domain-containing protein [Tanacetum cinerariifolium]
MAFTSSSSSSFDNEGNPQHALKDKRVIDSGCSRHMTGNMSYLFDFEAINGGYVAFGENPKGGKISGKGTIRTGKLDFDDVYFVKELKFNLFSVSQMCDKKNSVLFTDTKCLVLSPEFKLLDEKQVLLRVPRANNMYNVELKNIVPFRDLTCLFAKATLDESNLWHRRLDHINFKTMNKLVKGSGPTWLFDVDTLTKTMNYQPVTTGNQSNPSAGVQEQFNVEKAWEDNVQQYVLFPVWSSGSNNPQNTDGDAAFEEKDHESEVNASPSSSAQSKKHNDKTKKEAKGKKLEDITYSDDEEDVGAEADFTNLETTITVSPIPITRVHKDHPVTQIIGGATSIQDAEGLVARIEAIRLFLAYASFMGFIVYQMDVKSAFIYGTIKEEVYVCQPLGFEDPDHPDKVYKVVKRGKIDQALFIKGKQGDILLVQIYVDDIIFGSTNKDLCKAFEKLMKDKFQMSSMAEILRKFGLANIKSTNTPIDTEKPLLKDPDVKRIFRYLKGKPHLGLWYPKDSPFNLVAYLDIDYAGASLDRKSTTGVDEKVGIEVCVVSAARLNVTAVSSKFLLFVKKVNDVSRLQALLDRKKVMITEATIRDALRLDDAEGIDCLPNEEIFTELARMGYKNPSTKLTFYKVFFLSQLKFLIHTILQCMSAKRTSWNEFSSSMASAIICLSTGKGCSRVETPLFEGMIVAQQVGKGADEVNVDDVYVAGVADEGAASVNDDDVPAIGRKAESQGQIYQIDLEHADKVLSMQDDDIEPAELQEVVEVVTTAKLITEVVTAASATITVAAPTLTTAHSVARRRNVEKEKNYVMRYQALKRKPQTEAQARKNMMIYLRNMAGFKMDYFKGMKYDDICPIFEKYFNSNVAFLEKTKEQIEEEDNRALKRINESQEDKSAKKSTSSNLKESKKCSWSGKGQKLEAVRVIWCADYNIYYNTVDLAGREEISTYKVHFGSNAQQFSDVQIVKTVSVNISAVVYKLRLLVSAA